MVKIMETYLTVRYLKPKNCVCMFHPQTCGYCLTSSLLICLLLVRQPPVHLRTSKSIGQSNPCAIILSQLQMKWGQSLLISLSTHMSASLNPRMTREQFVLFSAASHLVVCNTKQVRRSRFRIKKEITM